MSLAERVVAGLDANRTIKDELTAALTRQGRRRRISVTDLVNPRQAFFQRTRPDIQPDPERKQAMLAGTGFHEVFGHAVSTEEFVEQFVEFQGIVGKIDIYEDVPVELKTTASLPAGLAAAAELHRPARHVLHHDRPRRGPAVRLQARAVRPAGRPQGIRRPVPGPPSRGAGD